MTREESIKTLANKMPIVEDLIETIVERELTTKPKGEVRRVVLETAIECIEAVVAEEKDIEALTKIYNDNLHVLHDRLIQHITGPISTVKIVHKLNAEDFLVDQLITQPSNPTVN